MCVASSSWIASIVSGGTSRSTTTQPSSASTAATASASVEASSDCTARVAGIVTTLAQARFRSRTPGGTGRYSDHGAPNIRDGEVDMDVDPDGAGGRGARWADRGDRRRLGCERGDHRARRDAVLAGRGRRTGGVLACRRGLRVPSRRPGGREPRSSPPAADRLAEGRHLRPAPRRGPIASASRHASWSTSTVSKCGCGLDAIDGTPVLDVKPYMRSSVRGERFGSPSGWPS